LLDLLGSKSERRDQFYNYLHQNVCQGRRRRDAGINTKSAEEVLEGREKVNQCVVASTHFFDRLGELECQGDMQGDGRKRHTASKMPNASEYCFCRREWLKKPSGTRYSDECISTYY
jgi:hypothetical protein